MAGGWQFVLDPISRKVIAAKERLVNENMRDKVAAANAAVNMRKVNPNAEAIIHDDACHFQTHVKRNPCAKAAFKSIKRFVLGELHRCNHRCSKKVLTSAEKKRLKKVRTIVIRVRRKNFTLNGMSPYSHLIWGEESISVWNANLRDVPKYGAGRTAAARARC